MTLSPASTSERVSLPCPPRGRAPTWPGAGPATPPPTSGTRAPALVLASRRAERRRVQQAGPPPGRALPGHPARGADLFPARGRPAPQLADDLRPARLHRGDRRRQAGKAVKPAAVRHPPRRLLRRVIHGGQHTLPAVGMSTSVAFAPGGGRAWPSTSRPPGRHRHRDLVSQARRLRCAIRPGQRARAAPTLCRRHGRPLTTACSPA